MTPYKIDKDIPIPGPVKWGDLQVGDSFHVPGPQAQSVRMDSWEAERRHNIKLSWRDEGYGMRMWRTA